MRNSQHGFTTGRSCLTNLLDFMEVVTTELDDGNPIDLVYRDFAKAFDTVPYQRLFKKNNSHGINGSVLNGIKNWLSCRRQRVGMSKEYFSWRDVTSGVPLGSV